MIIDIDTAKDKVETDSALIQDIVNEIIQPYVADLDKYVDFIKSILTKPTNRTRVR